MAARVNLSQLKVGDPDHDLTHSAGWLSPDGVLYGCEFEEHEELAEFLCEQFGWPGIDLSIRAFGDELVRRGWVKLRRHQWFIKDKEGNFTNFEVTAKQWDTILLYCTRKGMPPPPVVTIGGDQVMGKFDLDQKTSRKGVKAANCVQHRDGWCAVATGVRPKEGDNNVPTRCKHVVVLPSGFAKRVPDCQECLLAMKGKRKKRSKKKA